MQPVSISTLIDRYQVLLFDAYGVIVSADKAFPEAIQLFNLLNKSSKPYYIVTNDSSKLPETALKRYRGFGLDLREDAIISSGSLLKRFFIEERLIGSACVVLGPPDSHSYVEQAGGNIVEIEDDFSVVVIGDEAGFPFLEYMDRLLSALSRKLAAGQQIRLVLPNPDLIFPSGKDTFGFAAGTMAMMLENALKLRFPGRSDIQFTKLGKPYAPIFEEAVRRSGSRNMVMIGDQIETDIRGAKNFGIDSALIATGVVTSLEGLPAESPRPEYFLQSLAL